MSKTYSVPASALYAYKAGSGANNLSLVSSPDAYRAGYNSISTYGTRAKFDLSSIDADAVTGISIKVERVKGDTNLMYTVALYDSIPTSDFSSTAGTGQSYITTNREARSFTAGSDSSTAYSRSFSFDAGLFDYLSKYGYIIYHKNQSRIIDIGSITAVITTDENDYTLAFDANGGAGAPSSITAVGRTSATIDIPVATPYATGYTFSGWAESSTATAAAYLPGESITITSAKTLYAVWTPETYEIAFDANGGTGAPASQTKIYGVTLKLSTTVPVRAGYTFESWADSNGNSWQPGSSFTINAITILTAQWKANQYTLTFDPNGGEVSPASLTVTFANKYPALPVPTRYGYSFSRWTYGGEAITSDTVVSTASDHTAIAQWTANQYEVTYTDGISERTQTITHDVPWTASLDTFEKTGYTQAAWESDSGYTIVLGQQCEFYGTMTLYAVFAADQHTITFDPNGGSVSETTITVAYDSAIGKLPIPEYKYHTFLGWKYGDQTGYWTSSTVYKIDGDATLTADWEDDHSTYKHAQAYLKTSLTGDQTCKACKLGRWNGEKVIYGEVYLNVDPES